MCVYLCICYIQQPAKSRQACNIHAIHAMCAAASRWTNICVLGNTTGSG